MYSKLQIANVALTRLGEQPIVSLTQPTRNADRINAIFALSLGELLITSSWSEAIRIVTIPSGCSLLSPIEGYTILKVINSVNGERFSIMGTQLTAGGSFQYRVVISLPEDSSFGIYLSTVLIAKLAYELSGTRPSQQNTNYQEYLRVLAQVASSDAQQESGESNRFRYGLEVVDVR